ncbi:hypothetical protein [Lactobacillus sp. LL6]|uniref:hypothetical protein n=1 Tax=Lactobacillus sp. LL6 TaxID=2596827 RepID=UPI001186F95A|nr:hypothetical protein [Lactobacillus sp. LL6]TSO26221.1 hypothetical protein FOD82_03880 [Lactobacillus sp. LL6]
MINNKVASKQEKIFAKLHAQDGSPKQVAEDRVSKLRKLDLTDEEIFINLKKDFCKHFSDEEIHEIIDE